MCMHAGLFVVAGAAAGFVDVLLAEEEELLPLRLAVGEGSEVAAAGADGVELGDVFGFGQ